jgi:hypothetical protein
MGIIVNEAPKAAKSVEDERKAPEIALSETKSP